MLPFKIACILALAVKRSAVDAKEYHYVAPISSFDYESVNATEWYDYYNSVDDTGVNFNRFFEPHQWEQQQQQRLQLEQEQLRLEGAGGRRRKAQARLVQPPSVSTSIINGLTALVTPQRAQSFLANRAFSVR